MARNDLLELAGISLFVIGFIGWFVTIHRISVDLVWLTVSGVVLVTGSLLTRYANRGGE